MGLILSGVQPTGNLHLGNYLGAIKNWVKLQDEHKCLFMLADLHAITVPQDPAELRENVMKVAALYIACGIDPKKSVIFNQSRVSGHSELAWLLGCQTPMGWLDRMTQFKDKSQQNKFGTHELIKGAKEMIQGCRDVFPKFHQLREQLFEVLNKKNVTEDLNVPGFIESNRIIQNEGLKLIEDHIKVLDSITKISEENFKKLSDAKLGLYSYPVLMAADILLYNATHVPVGDDQKQHLELARDIAGAFNRNFKTDLFTIPEPLIQKSGARVMSLQDYSSKMSKSDPSEYSRVNLTDDNDTIRNKAKKAKTDSIAEVYYDVEARPDVANLLSLLGVLTETTPEAAAKSLEGKKSSDLKTALADALIAVVEPVRNKYLALLDDRMMLMKVLDEGAAKANDIARANYAKVKEIVGFI